MPRQRASQASAAFARVGTAPVPAEPDDAPTAPASSPANGTDANVAVISASEKEISNAGRNDGGTDGRNDDAKAGDSAAGHRQGRRLGRPRGPARTPLTVRILLRTDERLTAAVEATGHSPQYIVDEALARYLDSLGL